RSARPPRRPRRGRRQARGRRARRRRGRLQRPRRDAARGGAAEGRRGRGRRRGREEGREGRQGREEARGEAAGAQVTLLARVHPPRRALFAALLLLLALGVASALTSARSIYPRVAFPRIAVIAERGDQAVRTMLVSTTLRLERAVSTVPGIQRVR